jgi:hypothetical protein
MMQLGLALQEVGRAMIGTGVVLFIFLIVLYFYMDDDK